MYVVFGATGGIGAQLSALLAAQPGARVALAGRDQGRLQSVAETLPPSAQVSCHALDVLVPEQVRSLGGLRNESSRVLGFEIQAIVVVLGG